MLLNMPHLNYDSSNFQGQRSPRILKPSSPCPISVYTCIYEISHHPGPFIKENKQEAQGLGPLLDKIEDNDHIKLDNIEI